MPFYYELKDSDVADRKRTVTGILALRKGLAKAGVPARNLNDFVLLATWNIREFDSAKYGPRSDESYYYIAEILDHFDLVAIQEVREDLRALKRVQRILGSWWKYIVTDVTLGRSGNGERLAFLYDSRKVQFSGLAGEIVLPQAKGKTVLQFARTPFLCGFKAGWTSFSLCTVHIYYGTSKPNDPRRVAEIRNLAQALAARAKADPKRIGEPENLVLLGDFNIFARKDVTYRELLKAGFTIPPALKTVPGGNVKQDKYYDQIAVMSRPGRFGMTNKAGVFDYYDHVFRHDQANVYTPKLTTPGAKKIGYEQWRTYQMSDHLVMWCELDIDHSGKYLAELRGGAGVERPEVAPA